MKFLNPERWLALASLALLISCTPKSEQPAVKNGDVVIDFRVTGQGDNALVFVHGWCINKDYWTAQEEFFKGRFKVVTIDLGGHGKSGKNRNIWTVDEYAKDVIAVIEALDLKKVVLIGHSMSGDVNLAVASKIPERIIGFIGVDNLKDIVTNFSQDDLKEIDWFMNAMKANFDSVAVAYGRSALFPPNYADTVSVNRVLNDIRSADQTMAVATLESLMVAATQESDLLSKLDVPVCLIVSDYTPTNEGVVGQFCKKGLTVFIVNGTGHYPMIEKPEVFNDKLRSALSQIVRN